MMNISFEDYVAAHELKMGIESPYAYERKWWEAGYREGLYRKESSNSSDMYLAIIYHPSEDYREQVSTYTVNLLPTREVAELWVESNVNNGKILTYWDGDTYYPDPEMCNTYGSFDYAKIHPVSLGTEVIIDESDV